MKHWYVVFPSYTSEQSALSMVKSWGAKPEADSPPLRLEGDLCVAVTGPDNLPSRVESVSGVKVYDNDARPELMVSHG